MGSQSNTAGQAISLPKGGGALKGMGEKFAPDLHTGTGNLTIPITFPPGRNGFQPQLNLSYSSGNGNGPFGLGWSLSVPGVSRKTSKGIPRYDELKDVFVLSGAEDLVPVELLNGSTRFRPRSEGLFARIRHFEEADNNYWEVRSKDGLTSFYGTPRPTGANQNWRDPAVIVDPDQPRHIFTWKLSSTVDPFGNRIEYSYDRDTAPVEDSHHWDQLYLSEIRYADFGAADRPQFLITVRFNYQDRPDHFSDYRAGFEIRTVRRCISIEVFTHADSALLVRTYHLTYLDEQNVSADRLPLNRVSLLNQITVIGHDGSSTEQMPPLEFNYTRFEPEARKFFPVTGADLPPASLASPDLELVDLFGNGLPDILEMNGVVRYWRNLGEGRFDLPREMRDAPAGLHLNDPGVQLIDANGDGRPDLLVTNNGLAGYFPLRFGGLWDRKSFQRYRTAPSFNCKDPEVRLVDLDGDGVTDAIRSSGSLQCFFNDPELGWHETRSLERKSVDVFPNINFSDARVRWADMSGDGLQDIVLVFDGNTEYWPNLGYGNWGRRIHMKSSPRFPSGYNPRRILIGDVDGDGLADIVYVEDTKVTLWINQSGNSWSEPVVVEGTPPVSDLDSVRLTDLLGAGISGILWSGNFSNLSRHHMFFLDFTGGIKPYLLNEMNNHIGARSRVGYVPSTKFYLEDQKLLATRWKTPLPFPVHVVSRVEMIDEVSGGKLTTEYQYHHGYWDGAEREFRGFARVDQRDTETFEDFHAEGLHPNQPFAPVENRSFSPPLETRTWFHQGPIGDEFGDWEEADFSKEFWSGDHQTLSRPQALNDFLNALPRRAKRDALRALRGSVIRTELYALDDTVREDRPYTVTESLYGLCEVVEQHQRGRLVCAAETFNADDSSPRVFFPHLLAQRTTQWERGDDPMTQFSFTTDYDDYGQPGSEIKVGVPRRRNYLVTTSPGEPYLATYTVSSYAQRDDEQRYIVNRAARTTSYEILNDGTPDIFALRDYILSGTAARRIIGQTRSYYDIDNSKTDKGAFLGLPLGQIGDYGALVRTESLVLSEEILREAYKAGNIISTPPEEPPYLTPGTANWTTEYPAEFRNQLPALAGYTFHNGGSDPLDARGYFVLTARRKYDFHTDDNGKGRGLVNTERDALGRDTLIKYDRFDLLPIEVTDPAALKTKAAYDYRVLQPREITDANGNRVAVTFTPLGLLKSSAVMGKEGEGAGDTIAAPGTHSVYDFLALTDPRRRQPISIRTIRRVHHVNDTNVPLPERDETIESIEYSDGFGRLLQTRTQAEDTLFGDAVFGGALLPADQSARAGDAVGRQRGANDPPNVIVSGWQIYDNKGRVVEKYEPFFAAGWDYLAPSNRERGRSIEMFYDPRGQITRTVNPDDSEQRIVYGVPGRINSPDVSDPANFEPTPWEAWTYDANDNAGRTHPNTSRLYQDHWNTPSSIVIDALGRAVLAVERNGPNPASDWLTTRSTYDIRGNVLTVTDALGRLAFSHVYDLANRPLRIENMDAGIRRMILDAAGNTLEHRTSNGSLVLQVFDSLNRPVRLWARDGADETLTLREHLIYGDDAATGLTLTQAEAANLRGKLFQHYDEAGRILIESYDFKGNVLEKIRQCLKDAVILRVFNPPPVNWQVQPFRVDWHPASGTSLQTHAASLLDPNVYRTSITYDALNRVKRMRYPQAVDGAHKEILPRYNGAGALEGVSLDGAVFVEHIAYNAKGQRSLIVYGNGLMTRHAYDSRTFRLTRLRTEGFTRPDSLTYRPVGNALQDLGYEYDLAGNITRIHDRTPECGVPNTLLGIDALDREFSYDPLYRLLSANGRECDAPADPPWEDIPRCTDVSRARAYTESHQYDPVGNVLQLRHQISGGGFTRAFTIAQGGNRLATMTIGQTPSNYRYDANGNMVQENGSKHFEWDHSDRMRVYRTQSGNAEPSVHAQYFYDPAGQRVKKLVRKQGGLVETTVYVDGVFEHHRLVRSNSTEENNSLHVMDDQSRIALVRVGNPFPDDRTPPVKYHLGDHLGSSNMVVNASGGLINREEYTPYGETSFGSFARKRYRFTGKEKDEESGLHYFGARYYSPWIVRWVNCDPAGMIDGPHLYRYAKNNPIRLNDSSGTATCEPETSCEERSSQMETPQANQTYSDPAKNASYYGSPSVDSMNRENSATAKALENNVVPSQKVDVEAQAKEGFAAYNRKLATPREPPPELSFIDALKYAWQIGSTKDRAIMVMTGVGAAGGLIPYVGDYISLGISLGVFVLDPSWSTAGDVGLDAVGAALPVIPALGTLRRGKRIADAADTAHDAANLGGSAAFSRPRGYSVAYETTIPELGIGTRESHRLSANADLLKDLQTDKDFSGAMKGLGVSVPTTKAGAPLSISPPGWVWHHAPGRPGVMQLVPAWQHKWGTFEYDLMHDYGVGGYLQWGKRF